MRIATSTTYSEQAASIDNTYAQYQNIGQQLSTGISLNQPSDDPNVIGPDVLLNATIASEVQDQKASTGLQNQLTTVDTTLSSLTKIIQSARTIAVQGSSSLLTSQERKALAVQVDQLLNQSVSLGNTQFAGTYLFAGTKATAVQPVVASGNPITGVQFLGNEEVHSQVINGQSFAANVTLQQAFNYKASDGSRSVFDVLKNLRDTLNNDTISNASAAPVNKAGTTILGSASLPSPPGPGPTSLGNAQFAVPLQFTGAGNTVTIEINATDNAGNQQIKQFTFAKTDALDGISGANGAVVQAINAWGGAFGLTASFGTQGAAGSAGAQNDQRFTITSKTGGFYVTDIAGNLAQSLGLSQQTDVASNLSTQIGDVDTVLNATLNTRAKVGSQINALANLGSQLATFQTDNTKVKSGYEDTNIAEATTKFAQTQTALQAAYSTTSRLEAKSLLDYVTP